MKFNRMKLRAEVRTDVDIDMERKASCNNGGRESMWRNEEKLKRLVRASRMYYEENKTQADIAKYFAISRPMVSKLLAEARELGIVTIRITEATSFHQIMEEQLREKYGLRCARVVPMESDEDRTDKSVVAAAWKLVEEKMNGSGCLGIGWGSLIGRVADHLEGREQQSESGGERGLSGVICPLIGNAAASYRSYHPNELVRILSGRTGLSPVYIYGPAIAESEAEKKIYENTDSYCQIRQLWRRLDVALINISNYPSSPDMATALRFGSRLSERKAAGHMLSYFYDREGRFIPEDSDRILRISREDLASAGSVTALCAGGVKAVAAAGALATGLITDLILNETLAAELLKEEFPQR